MPIYYYLIQRKSDGKKFVAYGNLKNIAEGLSYLFEFVSEDYIYGIKTKYGIIKNISSDKKYNSKEYKVLHQYICA